MTFEFSTQFQLFQKIKLLQNIHFEVKKTVNKGHSIRI